MMMDAQLNIAFSQKLKERGMERATNHANQVSSGWSERAYVMLRHFFRTLERRTDKSFMGEDFRLFAYARGLEVPPSERAFGGVIAKAAKAGLITSAGTAKVKNPKAHQANAAVWRLKTTNQ